MEKHSENKVGGRKAATAALKQMLEGTGDELDHLLRFAARLCGDEQEAHALVQEACYRALKAAEKFDESRSFRAWITTLLHNAFIDRRRLRSWAVTDSLDKTTPDEEGSATMGELMSDGSLDVEAELVRREEAAAVSRGLAALAEGQRQVIALCDLAGMSYEEAAKRLGVPLGTVRSRLARGRAALRRVLGGAR